MALKCQVCEYKNQEIEFLRQTIKELIEQKKIESATFSPVYVNDLGQTVSMAQATIEESVEGI